MNSESGEPTGFRLRSLAWSVYLPSILFAIGQGAAIPVVALVALDLGASPALAGAIVALRGIGTLVFDVPASLLVDRFGEKRAIVIATVSLGLVAIGIATRPSLIVYSILVFLLGGAWSIWALARLTYVTEATPLHIRGRAMSLMGGTMRVGQFVGPLLGGLVIAWWGLAGPFMVQAFFAMAAAVAIALTIEPTTPALRESKAGTAPISMKTVIRSNLRTLGTAGFVAVAVQILRSTRQVIIPLWGDHIGLNASQISLIFGVSAGIEMVLFYPIGMVMDRKGRKWAALPCLIVFGTGMTLIPLTDTFTRLLIVGLILGVGNGLGAGINMTLGSDLSPELGRNQFFGVWRFISDVGTAGGPLLVAALTSLISLGAAAFAAGAIGLIGAGVMWKAVPETLRPDPD